MLQSHRICNAFRILYHDCNQTYPFYSDILQNVDANRVKRNKRQKFAHSFDQTRLPLGPGQLQYSYEAIDLSGVVAFR